MRLRYFIPLAVLVVGGLLPALPEEYRRPIAAAIWLGVGTVVLARASRWFREEPSRGTVRRRRFLRDLGDELRDRESSTGYRLLIGAWLLVLFSVAALAMLPVVISGLIVGAFAGAIIYSNPELGIPAVGFPTVLFIVWRRWFGRRAWD